MNRLFLLLFFAVAIGNSQTPERIVKPNSGNRIDSNFQARDKEVNVEGEKPPITDYLIISKEKDTTYVDTTLSMRKDYKFNYLRQDDFELLPLHNVGKPYNQLGKSPELTTLIPSLGAQARFMAYVDKDDIQDYHVPTPLTELYFKTAINQGQQLDAFFTSNISPDFNFAIGYKGVRSAGNYVNTLTSTGIFRFSSSYQTKNKKYRLRLHTVFQNLDHQENGGLNPASLEGFLSGDADFRDRGRLDPNLDDAVSILNGKRFYIHHDYQITGKKDSTSFNSLRIYNTMFYEDQFYSYDERSPTTSFLGESINPSNIKDRSDLEQGQVELGATFQHHLLGDFKAGISRSEFNYGYNRIINLTGGEQITNRLLGEIYQFNAGYTKQVKGFQLKGDAAVNVVGDVNGQFLAGNASYDFKDFSLDAGITVSSKAPDFNFTLFQSDYSNYNWQNDFENIKQQQLSFGFTSDKFLNASLDITTIQDHVYFQQQQVTQISDGNTIVTGFNATPLQYNKDIAYLKLKLQKDVKLPWNFSLDTWLMYQNVSQDDPVFNVPDVTFRSSLYYENEFFKKALLLQTGMTVKYFNKYYMDAYDPVLGSFMTQRDQELGGFPLVDVFVNAKIQQTRIFFKLEHLNQLLASGDNYFSAPRMPFRDFSVRFGLVWNFFL